MGILSDIYDRTKLYNRSNDGVEENTNENTEKPLEEDKKDKEGE